MLRNQGIRTKLLAVLALPIVALIVVTTIVSLQTFDQARQARQVEKLAKGADTLGALVTNLQSERSITAAFLGKRPVRDEMLSARKRTDKALEATKAFLGEVDISTLSSEAKVGLTLATESNAQLGNVRKQVDTGYAQPDRVADRYTAIIGADISLPSRIGEGLSDRVIGGQLAVYSDVELLAELATQERELGLTLIATGEVDDASASTLAQLAVKQDDTAQRFRRVATRDQSSDLDGAIYLPVQARAQFNTMQSEFLSSTVGKKIKMNGTTWRIVSNDRLSALQKLPAPIAASTASIAAAKSSSASNRALLMLIGSGLLVLLLIGLGLTLARAITRPLRHLTKVAGDIAEELPRMVERMATPGDGPGMSLPEIPINSNDEVGQLAAAFKEVNATTVRVAEEQAALRASIAEMFVNVARRNHVLLSRQLSFIDQLERTEENPDTLDNLFRLDHLATRMRRNAESLIVLAGIDAGRRLRRPMPLSDVIRTAVSEIERYDRVDLALQIDPPMVGHVALTTAHLLAELLENATQFSNPDTRVISSTALTSRGVRITITDLGLGMTWDEINEANQRIAAPPSTEVVGSQRLGFYVVGRLARRLDTTVELKPGRAQGTVVTIDLPPSLFVSGSIPQPEPAPLVSSGIPSTVDSPDADGASDLSVTVVEDPAPAPETRPTTTGLPSRGSSSSATSEPTAPHELPPAPGSGADGDLPRRSASTPAPLPPMPLAPSGPAAPVTADASGAPRSGIFSTFRSRRAVETEVGAVPAPAGAQSLEELATQLPDFVPTLDTSTPALPHRGDQQTAPALPQRGSAPDGAPEVAAAEMSATTVPEAGTSDDLVATDAYDVAPATDDVLDLAALPSYADSGADRYADSQVAGVEPADIPTLLDIPVAQDPVAPVVEPVAVAQLADEPMSVVPSPADDVVEQVETPDESLVPAAAASEVADPEPAVSAFPVPVGAFPVPDGAQARSTLSELAREVPAPVQDPTPQPAIAIGTPALDILPGKNGGRGLRLRRTSRPRPVSPRVAVQQSPAPTHPQPIAPAAPRPVERPPAVPVASASPAPADHTTSLFGGAPAPVAASPFGAAPTQAGSSASAAPAAEASSLFAPAPADGQQDATEQTGVTTPAFPPTALPALAAAQSLRERSAMAAEALSELSALSSYRPESLSAETRGPTLTRRNPQTTPAAQIAQPQEPQGARRANRSAADVRSMLSGFRAGVERGRTSPGTTQAGADDTASVTEGVEP